MDSQTLLKDLAEAFVNQWSVTPTGTGFLVTTDWTWPNGNAIEISVRTVDERESLFLVTDGGELLNNLFLEGFDFTRDTPTLNTVKQMAEKHGTELVEYQIAKGANESSLASGVRHVLETVKEVSFYLWKRMGENVLKH